MLATIKLYKNTWFDAINLPSSPKVIEDENKAFYEDDINIVQSGVLQSVRVPLNFTEVCDTDYVVIKTSELIKYFYTVEKITMLNENVAELFLLLDPICTIGGLNEEENGKVKIVYAWANRICVDDDLYGKYTLPENDFTPNEPLQVEISQKMGNTSSTRWSIALATMLIEPNNTKAIELKPSSSTAKANEGSEEPVLLLPKIEKAPITNYLTLGASCSTIGCALDARSSAEMVKRMRQYGIENSIIASYVLPNDYIGSGSATGIYDTAYWATLTGADKTETATGITIQTGAVNQKCNIGQFNKVLLCSNCSGEKIEALPEDVVSGGSSISIRIIADLRYDGKPTATFSTYKGKSASEFFIQAVNGLQWANFPINFVGKSGSEVERFNFKANQEYEKTVTTEEAYGKLASGKIGGAVSIVGGIAGIATGNVALGALGIARGVGEVVSSSLEYPNTMNNLQMKQQNELAQFNRNQYYTQPQINFPASGSVRDALGNAFYIVKYKLSANDLAQFDNYLTMFGYNVGNKKITYKNMYDRLNFNYVKLNDIQLSTAYTPLFIREAVEQRLKFGVRLWHTKPASEKCIAGGNPLK